jgi:acyl-CoA thioester hydrolase
VRFAECDPQGVVFNAHYLAYLDVGMTELWRAAFGSYQAMLDRGIDMVVVEARLSFHAPARFDDELRLQITISRLGSTSISTDHRVMRGDELIAQADLHHVFVDRQTLGKTEIPDWLRTPLSRWLTQS